MLMGVCRDDSHSPKFALLWVNSGLLMQLFGCLTEILRVISGVCEKRYQNSITKIYLYHSLINSFIFSSDI